MEKCVFCGYGKLYLLASNQYKCARCKKKLSASKYDKTLRLLHLYCSGVSATEAAKQTDLGYPGVFKQFGRFRKSAAIWEQKQFDNAKAVQYDEHFYLPHKLQKQSTGIHKAKNILIFACENGVDTQLLPFEAKYPRRMYDAATLKNFIRNHRIARLQNYENDIFAFVRFLETHLKRYRGVDDANFAYYLKEAQFFYNHDEKNRAMILRGLMKYLV